jgi:RyR domain
VRSGGANNGGYRPAPLDTSCVRLPDELLPLVEELAVNAHETWADLRLQEGWRYGHVRSDEARTHPCLVPYEQLPDSEKLYDRKIVLETIRAMLSLGYEIGLPRRAEKPQAEMRGRKP